MPAPLTTPSPAVKVLSWLQIGSAVLATTLVGLTMGSYAYSVYVDRQLHQASVRLRQLQRHEQQLTTANEVLKNHLARQAEQSSGGLQPPNPDNVIFLKPTAGASPSNPSHSSSTLPLLPNVLKPLGY